MTATENRPCHQKTVSRALSQALVPMGAGGVGPGVEKVPEVEPMTNKQEAAE